jgi:GNAT superfamily N-acetyltransferase
MPVRFTVRPAGLRDSQALFGLIKANAIELKSVGFRNKLERIERQLRLHKTEIIRDEAGVETSRRLGYLSAAERLEANLDDPDSLVGYFVAEERSSIMLGFASVYYGESSFQGDTLPGQDLYILPAVRRQSIGRALYRTLRAHAEERGKCRVDLIARVGTVGVLFLNKMAEESSPRGRRVEEWITYRFDLESHALRGT